MKKSMLGNFRRNNANNCPKKHLELSFDGTIALGAATQLSTKNFTKALTGVTESGYTFPDDLDPIFAKNAGETVEIYAQMLTDTATDAANYNTINDITIRDVTLTGTNKTKELYLITKSRGTAVGTEDKPQCMLMMIRNATGTQIPEEIEPLHFVYYTKLPSNLATILEYPTANTTFHAEFDIKTGNYGGDPGVGDYRVTLTVVEDGTGLRYRLQGDNAANGKDIVPGLTAYNNGAGGYWQEFSGYGEVVLGETIRIDFKITPPASNADVTTGETTVRITKVSDGSYVLLSKVGGVQKGIANLPLSRFMFILYNLGTPPGSAPYLDKPLTGIEIWDKPPRFLGWSDTVAIDTSLAGGTTQPQTGTDTLSIDFTSGTPTQVAISVDSTPYAEWPSGALSGSFASVTGGLEFDLDLSGLSVATHNLSFKASYADYRKALDSLSLTITEAVTFGPEAFVATSAASGTLYGSPAGNDANPGTFASPKTWTGAITAAAAGDVVFLRGGTYTVTAEYTINKIGTLANPVIIESYPGELAILDASALTYASDVSIVLSGAFVYFRNIEIYGMPRKGLDILGVDNIIDTVHAHHCGLTGISVYSAEGVDNTKGSRNTIKNCTTNNNYDNSAVSPYASGNNADGISIHSGISNRVEHCLVYENSDDGIDVWKGRDTYIGYNIVHSNGYDTGDGSGIKGGGASPSTGGIIEYNLVYSNAVIGLDSNSGVGQTFRNNTTWDNGAGGGVRTRFSADTIATDNLSSETTAWGVASVDTNNSWDIGGTVTYISTTPGSSNFLRPVAGAYDGIGARAV